MRRRAAARRRVLQPRYDLQTVNVPGMQLGPHSSSNLPCAPAKPSCPRDTSLTGSSDLPPQTSVLQKRLQDLRWKGENSVEPKGDNSSSTPGQVTRTTAGKGDAAGLDAGASISACDDPRLASSFQSVCRFQKDLVSADGGEKAGTDRVSQWLLSNPRTLETSSENSEPNRNWRNPDGRGSPEAKKRRHVRRLFSASAPHDVLDPGRDLGAADPSDLAAPCPVSSSSPRGSSPAGVALFCVQPNAPYSLSDYSGRSCSPSFPGSSASTGDLSDIHGCLSLPSPTVSDVAPLSPGGRSDAGGSGEDPPDSLADDSRALGSMTFQKEEASELKPFLKKQTMNERTPGDFLRSVKSMERLSLCTRRQDGEDSELRGETPAGDLNHINKPFNNHLTAAASFPTVATRNGPKRRKRILNICNDLSGGLSPPRDLQEDIMTGPCGSKVDTAYTVPESSKAKTYLAGERSVRQEPTERPLVPLGSAVDSDDEENVLPPRKRWCQRSGPLNPPPAPRKRHPASRGGARLGSHVTTGSRLHLKVRPQVKGRQRKAIRRVLDFTGKPVTGTGDLDIPGRERTRTRSTAGNSWPTRFLPRPTGEASLDTALDPLLPRSPYALPLSPQRGAVSPPPQALSWQLLAFNAHRQAARQLRDSLDTALNRSLGPFLQALDSGTPPALGTLPLSQAVSHVSTQAIRGLAQEMLGTEARVLEREARGRFLKDVRASLHQRSGPSDADTAVRMAGLIGDPLDKLAAGASECGRDLQADNAAGPSDHGRTLAQRAAQLLLLYPSGDDHTDDNGNNANADDVPSSSEVEVALLSAMTVGDVWADALQPPVTDAWEGFLHRLQKREEHCEGGTWTEAHGGSSSHGGAAMDTGSLQDREKSWRSLQNQANKNSIFPLLPALREYELLPLAEAWQGLTGLDWTPRARACWEHVHMEKVGERWLHPRRETAREVILFLDQLLLTSWTCADQKVAWLCHKPRYFDFLDDKF